MRRERVMGQSRPPCRLSSWPQLFVTFRAKFCGVGVEALLDRAAQLLLGGVAARGDLVAFDLLEHRLNLLELGAVRRQVVQVDPLPRQRPPLALEGLADV